MQTVLDTSFYLLPKDSPDSFKQALRADITIACQSEACDGTIRYTEIAIGWRYIDGNFLLNGDHRLSVVVAKKQCQACSVVFQLEAKSVKRIESQASEWIANSSLDIKLVDELVLPIGMVRAKVPESIWITVERISDGRWSARISYQVALRSSKGSASFPDEFQMQKELQFYLRALRSILLMLGYNARKFDWENPKFDTRTTFYRGRKPMKIEQIDEFGAVVAIS